jgi:hypothetical protein
MMKKHARYCVVFVFAASLIVSGCTPAHQIGTAPTSPIATTVKQGSEEAKILEIAKKALTTNDASAEWTNYEVNRREDGWSVTAWRVHGRDFTGKRMFVSGGHRMILIDKKGRVTDYVPGA